MYGMVVYVILTVFIAGLMVGRTPEYLGKKIEAREMKAVMAALLVFPLLHPRLDAPSARSHELRHGHAEQRRPARLLRDPLRLHLGRGEQRLGVRRAGREHARSTTSASALSMLVGRFLFIVAVLVIAGTMVAEAARAREPRARSRSTAPIFGGLLAGVIVIVGLLTFFPALALGPIVEHSRCATASLF